MPPRKQRPDPQRQAKLLAEIRRDQATRDAGYREQALKLFPHVCARCGREFAGKTLRELTVHHKDHNHANNPPDGSNWELLCLYCHDNEHQDPHQRGDYEGGSLGRNTKPTLRYNPFEGLKDSES
jgi:hypothetical protein